jgi:hypothetical protein
MKYLTLVTLAVGLVGCSAGSPISKIPAPDEIRSYDNGTLLANIKNESELSVIMNTLLVPSRKWDRYYITTPSVDIILAMRSGEKAIGRLLIGNDFIISETAAGVFSTTISVSEYNALLHILKPGGSKFKNDPEPTPRR